MLYLKIAVDFLEDTEDLTDSEFGRLIRAMMKYAEDDGYNPTFKGKESGKWLTARKGIRKQWADYRQQCERNKRNASASRNESERVGATGSATPQYEYESDNKSDSLKEKEIKKKKERYGEYNNVKLTDEELEKLKTLFPDWEERIERLSSYIASKGDHYKSHYATIRNWANKDGIKTVNKAPAVTGTDEIKRLLGSM